MKKFNSIRFVFISVLVSIILSGCVTTGKEEIPQEERCSAFGNISVVMEKNEQYPEINGVHKSHVKVVLRDNKTNKTSYVWTDKDGFYYFDNLKMFNSYTILKVEFAPFPQYPDSIWTFTWPYDFSASYEKVVNLGTREIHWVIGEDSYQNFDFEKSISEYEEKRKEVYERPVFKGPANYDHVQKYKDSNPDSYIKELVNKKEMKKLQKSKPDEYIKVVSGEIKNRSEDIFDKAKLAHDVVALILEYDADNYWKGKIPDQGYKSVLKTGKSVCAGYASVYKAFCDELHIPCIVVAGFAKGVGFNPESLDTKTNHDWNIVLLDGGWYLIDCTWDSGYMDGYKSVQSYETSYLFAYPDQMIYSHYPEREEYQLLEKPFSKEDIVFVPNFKPRDFKRWGLEIESFNSANGEFILRFNHEKDVKFKFDLAYGYTPASDCFKATSEVYGTRVKINLKKFGLYNMSLETKASTISWNYGIIGTLNYQ